MIATISSAKKRFRYQQLVRDIEARIRDGTYQPGEKLPSIRKLHRESRLSISTVFKAFVELEALGLVEARPRSGYFVSGGLLHQLKAPVHRRIISSAREVQLSSMINSVTAAINNPRLLPLGMTVADPDLLPCKAFHRLLRGISLARLRETMSYALSEGDLELRRQVVRNNLGVLQDLRAEDIVITNGCMEAVSLSLLALTRPRDTVATEAPTNFSFLQLLKELDLRVMELPTHPRYGIELEAVRDALSRKSIKAFLLMPNFQNPLGALMPDSHKRELVELCTEQEVALIEDDVSAEIYFGEQRPAPLKAFDNTGIVITCSSFSKTLSPGLRIGWVIPGKRHRQRIQDLKAGTTVANSSLDQLLVAEYLRSGAYERHLRTLRSRVHHQVLRTAMAVQRHFPPQTRFVVPEGGSLLWVQLPPQVDGLKVHRLALKNHIAVVPGQVCSNSQEFREFILLSCAMPFTAVVEKGIETLGSIAARLATSRPTPELN